MRSLILLLLLATSAVAQGRQPAAADEPFIVRVRAADSTRQASMRITIRGQIYKSFAVDKPYPGSLHLEGRGGTATGTIVGELSQHPGQLTFASDVAGVELEIVVKSQSGAATPRYVARGKTVRVVRSETGVLSVESIP